MYAILRPLLFRIDPERAHQMTLGLLRWAGNFPVTNRLIEAAYRQSDPRLDIEAFGLRFANPVGLAAGYDKNGVGLRGLTALGFGHVEVGTVTRVAQAGNPRPRIYRVPEAYGLINSMGFPNEGVDRLRVPRGSARVGINIGKGKDTPLERAAEDYSALLRRVAAQADYVAVNVSSPNTLGLRQLQARAALEALLKTLVAVRATLTPRVPLLVKIGPDLSDMEIEDAAEAAMAAGIDGIIATNTTTSREGIPARYTELKGGLSGAPLRARANAVMRRLAQSTGGRLPLIGVGGIASAADALERLRAGARLVQVYTALVYAGPSVARQINDGLLRACDREGARSVCELIRQ
jgi:dihydroorotate dehydrogenase